MAKTSKKATESTQAPAEQPTIEASVETTPQLSITDLQMIQRIVDLASRRGAFQANEMTQVGEAYDKLAGFLAYVEEMQAKEKAALEATESDKSTSETPASE